MSDDYMRRLEEMQRGDYKRALTRLAEEQAEVEIARLQAALSASEARAQAAEETIRTTLLADEERRKLTGDALHAEGEVAALRAALQRAEEMIEAGVQAQMREHEVADLERAKNRAQTAMTVARLGGMVEGAPTHSGNFLQRVDALRESEAALQRKDEALREAVKALGECLSELEAAIRKLSDEGLIPQAINYRNRERWAGLVKALAAPDEGKGTKP
jgi:chromosome segregation ATPase